MTSLTPATTRRRTGIEMQDLAAATRMILAGIRNRCLLWLLARFLPVIALTFGNIATAHADGVSGTLINGRTVNGAVSATGSDVYTFKVPVSGGSIVLSLSEAGTHNDDFSPEMVLTGPGDILNIQGGQLFAILRQTNVSQGSWNVKISAHRNDKAGGRYALTLIELPGIPTKPGAVAELSTGNHIGSISRGQVDVWSLRGVPGRTRTLTLVNTAGKAFAPEIDVFSPAGVPLSRMSCSKTCSQDLSVTASGAYTVLAYRIDRNDIVAGYSLSVGDKN